MGTVPPKICKGALKIWLIIHRVRAHNLGITVINLTKLYCATWGDAVVIICVLQRLEGVPQQNLGGQ